jgi:Gram-negative bacterial TonB protein C-terminal
MTPNPCWKRFCLTLAVSCLLHAALVYMPFLFGASATGATPAMRGGLKPGQARVLNVTLTTVRKSVISFTETLPAKPNPEKPPAEPGVAAEPRLAPERTGGIAPLPIPFAETVYYTTDQLTKRPELLSDSPKLDVPEIELVFTAGTVILKLWINELGVVNSVDIEESSVPAAIAETAAAAFGKLLFAPGELNGRPVGVLMRIEVTYDDGVLLP